MLNDLLRSKKNEINVKQLKEHEKEERCREKAYHIHRDFACPRVYTYAFICLNIQLYVSIK